jgi:membrane protein implicated in regulation of membrane protease activity
MAKKIRTGLQSEISHIFSGVSIPKKRQPVSQQESPVEKPQTQDSSIQPAAEQQPVEQLLTPQQPVAEPAIEESPVEKSLPEQSVVHEPEIEITLEEETPAAPALQPAVEKPFVAAPAVIEQMVQPAQSVELPQSGKPVEKIAVPQVDKISREEIAEKPEVQISRKVVQRTADKQLLSKQSAVQKRQKVMIILVVCLSILLVFLLVRPFGRTSQSTDGAVQHDLIKKVTNKANAVEIKIDWPMPPIYPRNLRDPMNPKQEDDDMQKLVVTGITIIQEKKYASIGTQSYQVGDVVRGATITAIEIAPGRVEFEMDGKKWTYYVQSGE